MFIFTDILIVLYRSEDGLRLKRTPYQRSMVRKHDVSGRYYTERQVAVSTLALYWNVSHIRILPWSTILSEVCLVHWHFNYLLGQNLKTEHAYIFDLSYRAN